MLHARPGALVEIDTGTLTGLRDRALIGISVCTTFARANAVIGMTVKDYFTRG